MINFDFLAIKSIGKFFLFSWKNFCTIHYLSILILQGIQKIKEKASL